MASGAPVQGSISDCWGSHHLLSVQAPGLSLTQGQACAVPLPAIPFPQHSFWLVNLQSPSRLSVTSADGPGDLGQILCYLGSHLPCLLLH